jgi:hypothetical protein
MPGNWVGGLPGGVRVGRTFGARRGVLSGARLGVLKNKHSTYTKSARWSESPTQLSRAHPKGTARGGRWPTALRT